MINLSTSAFFERATRQIGGLRAYAEDLQQQIGTGKRLSRSSDDPVAAAHLRTLSRNERHAQIDQSNSDRANADLLLTDNALGSAANVVTRAKELAILAANGTLNDAQRASLATEISSLQQELMLVANGRNAEGHALFGGQAPGAAYERVGNTVTYVGTAGTDPIDLGEGQSVTPTMTGPEVFAFEVDGTPTDLFAVLGNLATALQSPADAAAASREAIGALDVALEKVTTAQTVIGARMGWVQTLDDRRVAKGEIAAEQQQAIGGADLATTLTRLQEIMTVLEASQASFVRLSGLSLFNVLR